MEINKRPTLDLAHKRVKLTPDSCHFLCVFSKLGDLEWSNLELGNLEWRKGRSTLFLPLGSFHMHI